MVIIHLKNLEKTQKPSSRSAGSHFTTKATHFAPVKPQKPRTLKLISPKPFILQPIQDLFVAFF
jgi:hypothetical protein